MDPISNGIDSDRLYYLYHDFKTPISTIMGMATMSWSELDDVEKIKERLTKIETASSYLLSMINDVLDYSMISNGKMRIKKELFPLDRIIDLLKQLHLPHFKKKNQKFEIKTNNIIYEELISDFLRLSQVLTNLLSNSMKYTGVGGEILLELNQMPRSETELILEMKVKDNGIGMSEDFVNIMFEPFSLEGKSFEQFSGSTGLGLYITKKIVALLEGEIHVDSKPKKGTVFTIRIPCGIPTEENEKLLPSEGFKPSEFIFLGKSIILVEDNLDMQGIISEVLDITGAKVYPFPNGLSAVDFFSSKKDEIFDAILMDINMPVMNGIEAIKRIRESDHPRSEKVPIIAFTAGDDPKKLEDINKYNVDIIIKNLSILCSC